MPLISRGTLVLGEGPDKEWSKEPQWTNINRICASRVIGAPLWSQAWVRDPSASAWWPRLCAGREPMSRGLSPSFNGLTAHRRSHRGPVQCWLAAGKDGVFGSLIPSCWNRLLGLGMLSARVGGVHERWEILARYCWAHLNAQHWLLRRVGWAGVGSFPVHWSLLQ